MPKTSTRRKGKTNQAAVTPKTKANAKVKHVETREEAATCSAQELRENVLSQMQAIGQGNKKRLYYLRQDFCNLRFRGRSRPGDKRDNKPLHRAFLRAFRLT